MKFEDYNDFEGEVDEIVEEVQPERTVTRAERRKRKFSKLIKRGNLIKNLGEAGGSFYRKHVAKVRRSLGYMDSSNVSHYAATKPQQHTQSHDNRGAKFNPPKRDVVKLDSLRDQDFEEEVE